MKSSLDTGVVKETSDEEEEEEEEEEDGEVQEYLKKIRTKSTVGSDVEDGYECYDDD